jgi:hypothetical protein
MLITGVSIAGGIYKWVDEHGITVYSATAPSGKVAKQIKLPPQPSKEVIERAHQEWVRHEQPQEVLGTIALGFVPTELATLPKSPMNLTVVIQSIKDESKFKFVITDTSPLWKVENDNVSSHQNFTYSLRPGNYKIIGLEVENESLSDTQFSLVTDGPNFTVPEGNCVYIG